MDIQPISVTAYNFYLPLVAIVLLAASLIVALDCAWRVEKRLHTFMKLLAAAVAVLLAKKVLEITGFSASNSFRNFFEYLDILSAVFVLSSMVEIYRIIRFLDGEAPP